MDKQLLRSWLTHPVSRIFTDLLVEHRDALKTYQDGLSIEIGTIGELNKIKGQILALEHVMNLEEFLEEKLTSEKVDNDGEDA